MGFKGKLFTQIFILLMMWKIPPDFTPVYFSFFHSLWSFSWFSFSFFLGWGWAFVWAKWLFGSLRCGHKRIQMWNWGMWRLGWGEPAETRRLLFFLHPTIHQLQKTGAQTQWVLLLLHGTTRCLSGRTRLARDNGPTAGLWPWFCPPVPCINGHQGHMVFWGNQTHRDPSFLSGEIVWPCPTLPT